MPWSAASGVCKDAKWRTISPAVSQHQINDKSSCPSLTCSPRQPVTRQPCCPSKSTAVFFEVKSNYYCCTSLWTFYACLFCLWAWLRVGVGVCVRVSGCVCAWACTSQISLWWTWQKWKGRKKKPLSSPFLHLLPKTSAVTHDESLCAGRSATLPTAGVGVLRSSGAYKAESTLCLKGLEVLGSQHSLMKSLQRLFALLTILVVASAWNCYGKPRECFRTHILSCSSRKL